MRLCLTVTYSGGGGMGSSDVNGVLAVPVGPADSPRMANQTVSLFRSELQKPRPSLSWLHSNTIAPQDGYKPLNIKTSK
jgi:hypothetical protein